MALVGTISGSNGTSNTAITGTLVIANITENFPSIPLDAVLFVSGAIGSDSKSVFGGDLVISGNADIKGDIAVVGGDLTTTSPTFNLVTGASSIKLGATNATLIMTGTLDVSGSTNSNLVKVTGGNINIGSTSRIQAGGGNELQIYHNGSPSGNAAITTTVGHLLLQSLPSSADRRVEVDFSGSSGAAMFRVRRQTGPTGGTTTDLFEVRGDGTILIGSASTGTGLASTTISNDLFLSTGIIAVNTDATAIQLVSSGNVTVKLDANNNATGHYFSVTNHAGTSQLLVNENGNVDVSGSLVVSGSSLATVTTTTFNLLNNALTGTLNVGGAVTTLNMGGPTTTASFPGDISVNSRSTIGSIVERLNNSNSSTGIVPFNISTTGIFYVNNPAADITANFTNVPTTDLRVITPTVILSQSATARIISGCQVDGTWVTINWANGVTPTGSANKQDVFGFSLIRSGSAWKVLGQMSTYG